MAKIGDDVLVYDIECKTVEEKPNANKDVFKVFGCYSYKTDKYYLLTKKSDIQKTINAHRFLVGFNNEGNKYEPGYDNTVLERHGIKLDYKRKIDLRVIFKRRASQMKIKKGMLGDLIMEFSLDFITRLIGIVDDDTAKGDIDYDIFKKSSWTADEIKQIKRYTKRDVEITKKLYEWVEDYFAPFKDFIKKEDVVKKNYLTDSTARYAYKAVCYAMGWSEIYDTSGEHDDDERIAGGYVAYPAGPKFSGNIYCLDYSSLYPHIMIMCNLYGRKEEGKLSERPVWYGGNKWEVEGTYYSDKLSKVGKLLRKWYMMRMHYKRWFITEKEEIVSYKNIEQYEGEKIYTVDYHDRNNLDLELITVDKKLIKQYLELYGKGKDRKEYSIKIIINTIYGILNNPYYKLVYDRVAGGDCTRIGRQWTIYARKLFREAGYKNLYSDTDSIYVLDKYDDKQKVFNVVDKLLKDIFDTVPFPQPSFDFKIDDEIKYIYFFKGGDKKESDILDSDDKLNRPKGYMKKNYLYVTKNNKVKIKNLGIRKKNISPLAKKIFWDYLTPKIKEGKIRFSKSYIKKLMHELLKEDIKLAAVRKSVNGYENYKSKTCIQAQIAQIYGAGIHLLIPNTVGMGAGQSRSYCTVDEFKEKNLSIKHVDLETVWNELDYFVKKPVTKNIFAFEKK